MKELLLKDLSTRLPYGVKGKVFAEVSDGEYDINGELIFYDAPFDVILDGINVFTEEIHVVAIGNEDTVEFIELQQTDGYPYTINDVKPYLRPMSSMTEEELHEYNMHLLGITTGVDAMNFMIWIYQHHLDILHFIEKGLALEAPEGMYKEWISIRGNLKEDKEGNIVGGLKI